MDSFKNINEVLPEIKKENPFVAPDNYFEDFYSRLQEKLEAEKRDTTGKQSFIIRFLKPAIGLAAALAIVFMLVQFPLKNFLHNEIADANVPAEMYDIEIESMVESIDDDSFVNLLDDSDDGITFSEDDLLSYASMNMSEYELYSETEQ